jgi:hypothetical protein
MARNGSLVVTAQHDLGLDDEAALRLATERGCLNVVGDHSVSLLMADKTASTIAGPLLNCTVISTWIRSPTS